MLERLNKVRKENPQFDTEMVNHFAKAMPDLLDVMLDGYLYDNHIGSKEVAKLAEKFIVNDKGQHIGFNIDYDTVINVAKRYIDINQADFYPCDLFVFSNIQFGDMANLLESMREEDKIVFIIRYSISALSDEDFPFFSASSRAYFWLKKNIEIHSQDSIK